MHEPLVLALYLPMFKYQPWMCKGTIFLDSFRSSVRDSFMRNKDNTKQFACLLGKVPKLKFLNDTGTKELLNSRF